MKKLIRAILLGATVLALTACSNGGSKFVGKWSCDTGSLGTLTLSIRNNGGNNYILNNPMISNVIATYKDGKLVGPRGDVFSIDKQSGKLIFPGLCEMSRIK